MIPLESKKHWTGCGKGRAVELTLASTCKGSAGACGVAANAFLTGPLDLREGLTLLIDRNVTLYGSRDPKVYEIPNPDATPGEPGKCGTSTPRPKDSPTFSLAARPRGGCRALINVTNAKNAAVMGEGVIDGRGYAKLIGPDYSWWEMARKAQPNDDLMTPPSSSRRPMRTASFCTESRCTTRRTITSPLAEQTASRHGVRIC